MGEGGMQGWEPGPPPPSQAQEHLEVLGGHGLEAQGLGVWMGASQTPRILEAGAGANSPSTEFFAGCTPSLLLFPLPAWSWCSQTLG